MKILKWMVPAVALLALGGSVQGETKIAVVDMARLVRAHPDTPAAESLLEKQAEEFDSQQKEMEAEYNRLKKSFEDARKETADKALSDAAREEKVKVAEDKLLEIRDFEKKIRDTLTSRQKQISDQRVRMWKRIVTKIRDILREYAAKKDYAVVLDAAGVGENGVELVLYSSSKVDITEDLLKLVEAEKPTVKKEELDNKK